MPRILARAPTRIDFGGGWTDVPPYSEIEGGFVCNLAIGRHVTVELASATGVDAPRDPMAAAALRRAGARNVEVTMRSEFPVGAGLGGSSAAGVALTGALAAWIGEPVARSELAERSRAIEVEELGVAGGRQDHYAAAFGGALGLTFGEGGVGVDPLPLPSNISAALERRCIVLYTGQSRLSGDTITAVLDAWRARDIRVLTALERMKALARSMAAALGRGDLDELGQLVGEHWEHQRSLHPAIPTPTIDRIIEASRRLGALGAKALGASGGGCVMVIASEDDHEGVRRGLASMAELLPFAVDTGGFTVLEAEPARSAIA